MRPSILPWLIALSAAGFAASDSRVQIEFPGFFSGRPDPRVAVVDSSDAQRLLDSFAVRWSVATGCALAPLVALSYNGARLLLDDPVLGSRSVEVRAGCVGARGNDPGGNLERLAVELAFRSNDLSAPGGPRPFGYLACAFPDSVRPASAPCQTANLRSGSTSPGAPAAEPAPAEKRVAPDGRKGTTSRAGLSVTYPVPER